MAIKTKPATAAYRDNWDTIFGREDFTEKALEEAIVAQMQATAERGEKVKQEALNE